MSPTRRRAAAILGSLLVAAAASIGLATPAWAEYIREFDTNVAVSTDTSFRIVETITYDFEGAYRHGIYRDIPLVDETLTGQRREYGISVTSVTMDGAPVPWVTSESPPFLNVRIGDPDTTITGAHTYVIDYTVRDGLRVITAGDAADPLMPSSVSSGDVELYWDFVGTGWDVPIGTARASVVGPATALAAACYFGPPGQRDGDECTAASTKTIVALGPVSLAPGDALTGSIVWPASAFSRAPRENISQGLPSNPVVGVIAGLIPAALLLAIPTILAVRHRREDAGAPVPGAPPQYAPPDGLAPAEMSAAWEGNKGATDANVLVATLLDLAARRWIDVSTTSSDDLTVDWVGRGSEPMRPWEESLVGVILKGATTATLSGYDRQLSTLWGSSVSALVEAQEDSGRRNPRGDDPDRRWNGLAFVAGALLLVGFVTIFVDLAFVTAVAFTAGIGAFAGFFIARAITPRRQTPQSARFLAQVEGFRRVLGTDPSASRREFAHRSGLGPDAIFATMLPYAVVFRLQDAWIGAFPDLTEEQLTGFGLRAGGIYAMDSLVTSGTSSMSSAMTAPSSGSGGGGSSGGGGGGGGGGSW